MGYVHDGQDFVCISLLVQLKTRTFPPQEPDMAGVLKIQSGLQE